MKNFLMMFVMFIFCLTGCSTQISAETPLSEIYSVGEEIELAGVIFNIYKIDNDHNELYLLAKNSIATTVFSDDEHEGSHINSYDGSLVADYINEFTGILENNGIKIVASGLIDKDDLYELGFKHSDGLSGLPYHYDGNQNFIDYKENFWVGGYCKYQTMSWVYCNGALDTQSCDNEYDVRPVIVITSSEIDK